MKTDILVVGGGLAGLAAATYAARAGKRVVLNERSPELGGRAQTQVEQGFHLNLGAHALYARGAGAQVLRELGVPFSGAKPKPASALAFVDGGERRLPGGLGSLATTNLFGLGAKLEAARWLARLRSAEAGEHETIGQWCERSLSRPEVKNLARALIRVSTYTADDRMLARPALAQLNLAIAGNVYYLDGGWQTLVDGLRAAAVAAGVTIVTGHKVTALEGARAYILAVPPQTALTFVQLPPLEPVRASTLDVALAPGPLRATFGLGIDQPHYVSVHSATAKLGPGEVIHAMRYGGGATREELERLVDAVAPGWRERVVHARFLPELTVTYAMLRDRRPDCVAAPGVFLCGDWVGDEGMLADAALASARRAARLAGEATSARAAA